ncbi:anthranilate phosphoribosyltransferase [Succinatimonas hippei]|uniref:anthranilate phosphoribosyltransferase n=1 Tax=Succinatimonas hippei TaxID=626938 RepID=UPI0026E948FD|nr:anthranilate phosphoribosyltransferase [Succinatimonas hippei]
MLNQFNKLYQGSSLSETESRDVFAEIFKGKLNEAQLSSLITALKIKGENQDEIAGAALAMLDAAEKFPRPQIRIGEIVGTGGDCLNTINISTLSAIFASCLGLYIAKHGNRAVSSKTGASDLLKALGYNLNLTPDLSAELLLKEGFAFMFAQTYHKAMKFAAPVRQSLQTRTIFNLLGPLTNPAHPDYELLGVYDKELLPLMAKTLYKTGIKRALCVNGNGMDEIAPFGITHYAELKEDGTVITGFMTKETFGITDEYTQDDLKGGSPEDNAAIALNILKGKGTDAQNAAIAVNTSALLYLADRVSSFKEGYDVALSVIKSGIGLEKLCRLCSYTEDK